MNNQLFYRIDDRLVHGQVMTSWTKVKKAKRIVILDDEVVKDDFICMIMKKTVPKDIELLIFDVKGGTEYIDAMNDEISTIILMKYPSVALHVYKSCGKINLLNIGGMGMKEGRKKLYKNISANNDEINDLIELEKNGVKIEFRILPEDMNVELKSLI